MEPRFAVVAERTGFDAENAAMGNYHHHQNPSAFHLDLTVISNICDLYLSDALYVIDSATHSPLLDLLCLASPTAPTGIKNADGTGGITRMKSSLFPARYLRAAHYANGQDVTDGPAVSANFPLGLYREDYQYNPTSPATPDYLDEHNGRFCVTPEYPNGTYCYFATVDENWNSAYPYVVGPTFYGEKNVTKVASVNEPTTTYNGPQASAATDALDDLKLKIFPNPAAELILIQSQTLLQNTLHLQLINAEGQVVRETGFGQGSTLGHFETESLYNGTYFLTATDGKNSKTFKVIINR